MSSHNFCDNIVRMSDAQAQDKGRVLIVEDDPMLVKMYKTKFESEGYEVVTAEDGEAGLKAALECMPRLMILDMMMPKLSGIGVLEALRKQPAALKIPVVVLSNLSHEDEAKSAFDLGAREYLVKANFTPGQVMERAKKYLT